MASAPLCRRTAAAAGAACGRTGGLRAAQHGGRRALHASTTRQEQRQDGDSQNPQQQQQQQQQRGGSESGKTFRGQLYESTLMRAERERQNQRRLAAERAAARGNGGFGGPVGRTMIGLLLASGLAYWAGTQRSPTLDPSSTAPLASALPPRHDLDARTLETVWADCVAVVGKEHVATGADELAGHARSDWSSYQGTPDMAPFLVVYPSSTEEVSGVVRACHARRVPVTAFAGGTSLEGHFVPTRGGVCIDFARMDRIVALHAADLDVVVQPAVGWEELNDELAAHGLFFAPDPGPGARIGGMVGTGCSGTNAFRYGTMREWVLGLTVVLADGTVVRTRQRPRKSSAGYDLTKLFIGSEGTLGLVTEATLKLAPLPPRTSVAVATFATVKEAADAASRVVAAGVPVAALELLDDVQMACINAAGATARRWAEQQTLLIKFAGTPAAVDEHIAAARRLAKSAGARSFDFAKSEDDAAQLWAARKEALWSVMARRRTPDEHVWVTDVAVPISSLPDIVDRTKADLKASGLVGSIVGHVGDGNFHAIILYNDAEGPVAEGVVHRMVKRAIELEGTVTGEHGVGITKRDYLSHELGQDTVDAMRKIKQALDPLCLLNCDKIVRAQPAKKGEIKPL